MLSAILFALLILIIINSNSNVNITVSEKSESVSRSILPGAKSCWDLQRMTLQSKPRVPNNL